MRAKSLIFIFALLVFVIGCIPIITGDEILTTALFEDPFFPTGNLLTAICFVALSTIFYTGISAFNQPATRREKLFSRIYIVLIILSVLWIPVGYLLSGNWSFNFSSSTAHFRGSPGASQLFWIYNYSLAITPILLALVHLALSVIAKRKKFVHPKEVVYLLRGIIAGAFKFEMSVENEKTNSDKRYIHLTCKGYKMKISLDGGTPDFVEHVKAPDGRKADYHLWYDKEKLTEPIDMLKQKEIKALTQKLSEK